MRPVLSGRSDAISVRWPWSQPFRSSCRRTTPRGRVRRMARRQRSVPAGRRPRPRRPVHGPGGRRAASGRARSSSRKSAQSRHRHARPGPV